MNETGAQDIATAQPATALEGLRAVPWLDGVPVVTLEALARQAVSLRLPAGAQLFEQAEIPAFAQILLSGTIELLAVRQAEEALVELVRPFDMVLPAAVLSNQPYLLRARVRDDAQLLLVQSDALRQGVASDHALCLAMLACTTSQLRRQLKIAKAIRLRSAAERVGSFMLALAEASPGDTDIPLPFEKRVIASQLGMTRETFSRSLPDLVRHGLRVEADRLCVDDLARARADFPYDPLLDGREAISPLALLRIS